MAVRISVKYFNQKADSAEVKAIKKAIETALALLNESTNCRLSVVICDEEYIRTLNESYRGIDASTDVLSFSAMEIDPDDEISYLGDIVISHPIASSQALQSNHSLENELIILSIHGLLHLLGYDHSTPEEKDAMWSRQNYILGELGIIDPVLSGDL
jgi:probable rRNA maturation factor